jgi:hypothetical protein
VTRPGALPCVNFVLHSPNETESSANGPETLKSRAQHAPAWVIRYCPDPKQGERVVELIGERPQWPHTTVRATESARARFFSIFASLARSARKRIGKLVDRLNAWARSGLEVLQGLSLLQVLLIAVLGLGLGYWAISIAVRSLRSAVVAFLALIAALALVRLCFPDTFCSVQWPTPIAAACSRG